VQGDVSEPCQPLPSALRHLSPFGSTRKIGRGPGRQGRLSSEKQTPPQRSIQSDEGDRLLRPRTLV
jgi:hypothetical protein